MTNGPLRVYFTIDTETSMGGAWGNPGYAPLALDTTVFGKWRSRSYGIPLIMDILERYGFRGTFFTELFCSYNVGRDAVASVVGSIQDRGHDVQLHLHPEQRFYREFKEGGCRREEGLIFALPLSEQRELIREGVSLFRSFTGKSPRAYRAGCYGASELTLQALRDNGIEIDSSYNLAYLGKTCGFQTSPLNGPVVIEGVQEFPVTVFRVAGLHGYKPLEISAVSVGEIVSTMSHLRNAGCHDVVLVLHSFSLLKSGGVRYEHCRPNHLVIRRLDRLCGVLARMQGDIQVCLLGEAPLGRVADEPRMVPSLSWPRPALRKLAQGLNRFPWL
jgi:peptidoglycan/xylan/chitin deacetylase (PgdA/CDA1 family)